MTIINSKLSVVLGI